MTRLHNDDIANMLERVADLLEAQHANVYRVRAYRAGAQSLRLADAEVAALAASEGPSGVQRLLGVGQSLAATIDEIAHGGRLRLLERLEGEVSPEDLFTTVPGIGETLAKALHDQLGLETLEELEQAASDGRLARLKGFGERRTRLVREALAGMLARSSRRRAHLHASTAVELEPPSVALLLDVDREYRAKVGEGALKKIAPRRFNPSGEAWLPILHVDRQGWHLTALFSNTGRAHQLGMTHDWVVIYAERDGIEERFTVVTEYRGPLTGRRVVRGREVECLRLASPNPPAPTEAVVPPQRPA